MSKLLIVVDVQRDFYHPEGSLYVPGAEKKVPVIEKAIEDFDDVLFTMDWHPVEHCSFKEYGGLWPAHCVADTEGAGIPYCLMKAAEKVSKHPVPLITKKAKCKDTEEYGAFTGGGTIHLGNNEFCTYSLLFSGYDEVVVCGIAAEYCVLNTLKNVKELLNPKYGTKLSVFLDGVAHFDPENKVLEDYMKENEIGEYKVKE